MASIFLTARWQHLVMLNYEVPPDLLTPFVPAGVSLDTYDDVCMVSMVGFMFLDTRLKGIPVPFHRNFEEVNLRFYVKREIDGELRRGVVFIKEIVPKKALALVARVCYNENYVAWPMEHTLEPAEIPQNACYRWHTPGGSYMLGVRDAQPPSLPADDTEACFITEHYWGYARQRDGGTVEYRVTHPQWQVSVVSGAQFEGDIGALYGPQWTQWLQKPPRSAFMARGSEVAVYGGERLS